MKNKNVKHNIDFSLDNNDKLISDDRGMASILNLAFRNVFTKQNNAVVCIPLKIFQGPDKGRFTITEIHVRT